MARLQTRMVFVVLSVVLLGCSATRAPLTCPTQGGPAWTEVATDHFILRTDLAPREAEAAAARFEQIHAALSALVPGVPRAPAGRFELVLFERMVDMHEVAGNTGMSAYFASKLAGDLEPLPVMVMQAEELPEEVQESFAHELTHRLLHQRFSVLPPWLNEGLAQYYSTLRLEGLPAGGAVLGGPAPIDFSDQPYYWYSWRGTSNQLQVPIGEAPTVWDLIHAGRADFYPSHSSKEGAGMKGDRARALYGAAWKLVHFFMNGPDPGYRQRFTAFSRTLEGETRARDAFLEVFGAELPRLEQDFRRYLLQGRLSLRRAALPSTSHPARAEARAMSDAEVHHLWGRLLPWSSPQGRARALRELDEALARDPGSPEVRFRRAVLFIHEERLAEADRELTRALAARPDEPRYLHARLRWYEARRAQQEGTGKVVDVPAELAERLARTASTGAQLAKAGWFTAPVGRSEEGLRRVERAIALDPLCYSCEETRAAMLANRGRTRDAMAAIDRAIAIWPEALSLDGILELRERIRHLTAP